MEVQSFTILIIDLKAAPQGHKSLLAHTHLMSSRYFDTLSRKISNTDSFVWTVLREGLEGGAAYFLSFSWYSMRKFKSGKCNFGAFKGRNGEKYMFSY